MTNGWKIAVGLLALFVVFLCLVIGLIGYTVVFDNRPLAAGSSVEVPVVNVPQMQPVPVPPVASAPVADPAPVIAAEPEKSVEAVVPNEPLSKTLFLSPVVAKVTFNKESAWLIAEPGVLLDNTTAWTIPGTKDTWYSNVPEGAFAYYSLGQGKITVDGYTLDLPYKEGHNYLVLLRGRIDDAKVDTDRNMTAEVTDFVPGHAIWSHMPKGAYVSRDWFLDQLKASTTESYTNCGALGCSHVTVVLLDVDTHQEQRFAVTAGDLTNWTQIK